MHAERESRVSKLKKGDDQYMHIPQLEHTSIQGHNLHVWELSTRRRFGCRRLDGVTSDSESESTW